MMINEIRVLMAEITRLSVKLASKEALAKALTREINDLDEENKESLDIINSLMLERDYWMDRCSTLEKENEEFKSLSSLNIDISPEIYEEYKRQKGDYKD